MTFLSTITSLTHLYLELFCKIIYQYHFCWTILNFHFPFIYSFFDKKIWYFISQVYSTTITLVFFILIELLLYWYTILFIITYTCPWKHSLAINCRVDIHSHQLAAPPWRFFISPLQWRFFIQHSMSHGYGFSSVTSHVAMDRIIYITSRVHICKALYSNDCLVINILLYPGQKSR